MDYAYDYILQNFPGVKLTKSQGTYMLYLDCTKWLETHDCTMDELIRAGISVGVIWMDGRPFNRPNSIRMNLALPRTLLEEALSRLKEHVFS